MRIAALRLAGLVLLLAAPPARMARGQAPVTRAAAVDAAVRRGTRLTIARSDSMEAEAQRAIARARGNPTLLATYSKAVPTGHFTLDIPFDAPWVRGSRIRAADFAGDAARLRFAWARAAVRFEADSTYTRAAAAEARARLSHRTAVDAESLFALVRVRRDAGDASELDVAVAEVSAGQLANVSAEDSIAAVGALLDVQRLMGMPGDSVHIVLADSLAPPADAVPTFAFGVRPTLPVLAATASVSAARASLRFQHRSILEAPSLQLGVERGDPAAPGWLPLIGIAVPLPFFDRRRGQVALASAGLVRAEAELDLARRESDASLARALRERTAALDRVRRDSRLLASAERVLSLSVVAYREGAMALPNVLEAARAAREALARYIDDVAAALTADAGLRWLTATRDP